MWNNFKIWTSLRVFHIPSGSSTLPTRTPYYTDIVFLLPEGKKGEKEQLSVVYQFFYQLCGKSFLEHKRMIQSEKTGQCCCKLSRQLNGGVLGCRGDTWRVLWEATESGMCCPSAVAAVRYHWPHDWSFVSSGFYSRKGTGMANPSAPLWSAVK